jgi:hypothetical protein
MYDENDERWQHAMNESKSPGTALVQVVKNDQASLIVSPRPEMDGGSRQFGDATLVPHASGIAPRGPKVLYVRDGTPTYVETLKCPSCGCYFTLTFTDAKTRTNKCVTCWRKAKDLADGITTTTVRTTPTVVIGPTTTSNTPKTYSGNYYGSSYSYVSPSKEFDLFFASLSTPVLAKSLGGSDSDDSDNDSWKGARRPSKNKTGKKKNKRDRRLERKGKKIQPHGY